MKQVSIGTSDITTVAKSFHELHKDPEGIEYIVSLIVQTRINEVEIRLK